MKLNEITTDDINRVLYPMTFAAIAGSSHPADLREYHSMTSRATLYLDAIRNLVTED